MAIFPAPNCSWPASPSEAHCPSSPDFQPSTNTSPCTCTNHNHSRFFQLKSTRTLAIAEAYQAIDDIRLTFVLVVVELSRSCYPVDRRRPPSSPGVRSCASTCTSSPDFSVGLLNQPSQSLKGFTRRYYRQLPSPFLYVTTMRC